MHAGQADSLGQDPGNPLGLDLKFREGHNFPWHSNDGKGGSCGQRKDVLVDWRYPGHKHPLFTSQVCTPLNDTLGTTYCEVMPLEVRGITLGSSAPREQNCVALHVPQNILLAATVLRLLAKETDPQDHELVKSMDTPAPV